MESVYNMYVCVVKNITKQGCADAYYEVTKRFAQEMKNVDGCIDAFVLKSLSNPCEIVNVEYWQSKEKKEADDGSVFLKYKPELKPLFISNTSEEYEKDQ